MEAKKRPEEFELGRKAESMLKGSEAMLSSEPVIHENSNESEVYCSESERCSLLDTKEKRMKINAGAMLSQFSEDDAQGSEMIDRGLQEPDTEA